MGLVQFRIICDGPVQVVVNGRGKVRVGSLTSFRCEWLKSDEWYTVLPSVNTIEVKNTILGRTLKSKTLIFHDYP